MFSRLLDQEGRLTLVGVLEVEQLCQVGTVIVT